MPGAVQIPRDEIIKQALELVYTDFEKYIKHQAMEHTVANLGQSLKDYCYGRTKPEHVVESAYHGIRQAYGEELQDEGEGVEDEYRDWLKEARKNCTLVKNAGLPWTLNNSRLAFERKGPFAKKAG